MEKLYCTFWYPTIFLNVDANIIPEKRGKPIYFNVEDDSDLFFKGSISIDDKECIFIKTSVKTNTDCEINFDLKLVLIEKRSNGFRQYELQFTDEETLIANISEIPRFKEKPATIFVNCFCKILCKAIYHKIKEFYHKHEADTGKDGDLIAIWDTEETFVILDNEQINQCNDNKYLLSFLENFEKMFRMKAQNISDFNAIIQLRQTAFIDEFGIENRWGVKTLPSKNITKISDKKFYGLVDNIKQLDVLCENSLIEYTYCKTLLHSLYNKHFKHNIEELEDISLDIINLKKEDANYEQVKKVYDENKGHRRQAINIRNSVRYIENIKYKNQNRQFFCLQKLTSETQEILKNGDKIQIISIGLGLLSIIFAIVFGFKGELDKCTYSHTFPIVLISSLFVFILGWYIYYYYKIKKQN